MFKLGFFVVALTCSLLPAISLGSEVTVAVVNVIRLQTDAPQVALVREKIKA